MRRKGLLLPREQADERNHNAESRRLDRLAKRRSYAAWLAEQPVDVQAERAAVHRFNYLFHSWRQFRSAWRNAPVEDLRTMLTNSHIEEEAKELVANISWLKILDDETNEVTVDGDVTLGEAA